MVGNNSSEEPIVVVERVLANFPATIVDPGDTPIDQIPTVDLTGDPPVASEPSIAAAPAAGPYTLPIMINPNVEDWSDPEDMATLVPPMSRTRYFQRLLAGNQRRGLGPAAPPGPAPPVAQKVP